MVTSNEGNWKKGKMRHGKMTYKNGDIYEGGWCEYKNDEKVMEK